MIIDLQHELAVLDAFFAKQAAWITTELARLTSAPDAATRPSEQVEDDLFHPEGPGTIQELLCRMTINELNALIETSLRHALSRSSGLILESDAAKRQDLVYSPGRGELERRLVEVGFSLSNLPAYTMTQEIREIAEGSKHRERLRPVPVWDKSQRTLVNRPSVVPGGKGESVEGYDFSLEQVSTYLRGARDFVQGLAAANPSAA